jgi:hypothetical protein
MAYSENAGEFGCVLLHHSFNLLDLMIAAHSEMVSTRTGSSNQHHRRRNDFTSYIDAMAMQEKMHKQ